MEHASNSPPGSPDISNIVGSSQLSPRVGHEYQVEVPSMLEESERLQLLTNPAHSDVVQDNSLSFACGLPISVIWIPNEVKDNEHNATVNAIELVKSANITKSSISDKEAELKKPTTFQSFMKDDSISGQLGKIKSYIMAPGTISDFWSDADAKNFLLGLFIFGKNFIQIKRFLGNKEMGDILSFYYGKFYKSDEYRRWSDCRKIKGRKCVIGQKLFTGQRQNELLFRLVPQVSEESQDKLLKISKSYMEGGVSLEEYVTSLKSTVGLGVLVEAVGIGKEKEDLTRLVVEPGKKNRKLSAPTSKAWSSLGPSDIIKFLSGGVQPSKTETKDIFWEAVWPRLLARGWHFEQPKNQGFVSSKGYLVFLIPGVEKFSRRNLVKGDHYFDSVGDLLNKVVAEPNLLLVEEDAKGGRCNDEEPEKELNGDDQSDYHRHCYLKSRTSTFNSAHVKFLVIDTSMVHGRKKSSDLRKLKSLPGNSVCKVEVDAALITYKGTKHMSKANHNKGMSKGINQKSTKLRELKNPPVQLKDASKLTNLSRERKGSTSHVDSPSEAEPNMPRKKNIGNADSRKSISDKCSYEKEAYDSPYSNANKIVESHQNQKTCVSDDTKLKTTVKRQLSQGARLGRSNHAVKRRRLTACAKAQANCVLENSSRGLGSEKLTFPQSLSFPDANKNAGHPVNRQQKGGLIASLADGCVKKKNEKSILYGIRHDMSISCGKVEKCESQSPNNLNTPQIPPKSEIGEMMAGQCLKANDPCSTLDTRHALVEKPLRTSTDAGSIEQQPDINPRRQSTRNRPLTVRALESLANEFLHVQRRKKRKEIQSQTLQDPFSPCRKARTRVKAMLNHHNSGHRAAVSVEEKHLNGNCGVSEKIF